LASNLQDNWPRVVRYEIASLEGAVVAEECQRLVELAWADDCDVADTYLFRFEMTPRFATALTEARAGCASYMVDASVSHDLRNTRITWRRLRPARSRPPVDIPLTTPDSRVVDHESFVSRALRLDRRDHIDAALDLLYDGFDELFRRGEFARADTFLSQVTVDECSVDFLLGILTASLPARGRLPSREQFYRAVELHLQSRGEFEEGLLTGLA
jgi:hypothetical protein